MAAPPGQLPGQMPLQQAPGQPVQQQFYAQQPQLAGSAAPVVVATQYVQYQPPNYNYTPHDFWILSLITIIFCGLFSPLSLVFSIPAIFFSSKSRSALSGGSVKDARWYGVISAYLNIAAILFALLLAIVLTGLVIGVSLEQYTVNRCLDKARGRYGFVTPGPGRYSCY